MLIVSISINAPLAQLVRAQSLYLWGPWFESMRAHKTKSINFEIKSLVCCNIYLDGKL